MAVCERCGFVHNATFDLRKVPYGPDYDNAQSCSPDFADYLRGLAERVLNRIDQNGTVVEVGSGNGYFLRLLVERNKSVHAYGFDPSYAGPAVQEGGRLRIESRYYGSDCTHVSPDALVCRHVIEHVPRPLELLRTIRAALENSKDAHIFFETPCVEWILRSGSFWDFFYEHCSLFSERSLASACELSGYSVQRVIRQFGGQYLWLECSKGKQSGPPTAQADGLVSDAIAFGLREKELCRNWHRRLVEMTCDGVTVAVWGAGAKGTTFVNLLDPDKEFLECLVDINPNKQGKFVAGTGHPIVAPRELGSRRVGAVIVMNPNYTAEIRRLLGDVSIALFDA